MFGAPGDAPLRIVGIVDMLDIVRAIAKLHATAQGDDEFGRKEKERNEWDDLQVIEVSQ